jgi:hypothetical protein
MLNSFFNGFMVRGEHLLRVYSRLSLLMVHTPSLLPGTRPSVSGNSPPVQPLADLLDTPTMFCPLAFPQTTDKSFPARATEQSSSGTLSEIASSPLPRRDTPTGFLAFDSPPTLKILSLSAVDGTNLLR